MTAEPGPPESQRLVRERGLCVSTEGRGTRRAGPRAPAELGPSSRVLTGPAGGALRKPVGPVGFFSCLHCREAVWGLPRLREGHGWPEAGVSLRCPLAGQEGTTAPQVTWPHLPSALLQERLNV